MILSGNMLAEIGILKKQTKAIIDEYEDRTMKRDN